MWENEVLTISYNSMSIIITRQIIQCLVTTIVHYKINKFTNRVYNDGYDFKPSIVNFLCLNGNIARIHHTNINLPIQV